MYNRTIAIKAKDDTEAARHLVNIMSLLTATAPGFDVDIYTGLSTLEAIKQRGLSDSPFAPGRGTGIDPADEQVIAGYAPQVRRLILMLQRTEGKLSTDAIEGLMKMVPVLKPEGVIAVAHMLNEEVDLAKISREMKDIRKLQPK